jgi:hypothetical protein
MMTAPKVHFHPTAGAFTIDNHLDTKTESKKRSRAITASNVVAKKRSNVDNPGPSQPTVFLMPFVCNTLLEVSVFVPQELCGFCGDFGIVLSCQKPGCDVKTCVEKTDGQVPCIVPSTLPKDEHEFHCPTCCHKDGKPTPVSCF